MTDVDVTEGFVREYRIRLCALCIAGKGGECHTPGCSLWLCRAPDLPLDAWRVAPSHDESSWPRPMLEPAWFIKAERLAAAALREAHLSKGTQPAQSPPPASAEAKPYGLCDVAPPSVTCSGCPSDDAEPSE